MTMITIINVEPHSEEHCAPKGICIVPAGTCYFYHGTGSARSADGLSPLNGKVYQSHPESKVTEHVLAFVKDAPVHKVLAHQVYSGVL